MDIVYWDHNYNLLILVNLAIVVGLFACLRLFSGRISHINATRELLQKDNPAFGISLAGVTLAITILLSGTIYGDPEKDLIYSALAVVIYGIVGIALMMITRFIFDKVALPGVSLRDEIVKGNVAVALADTGNVLAAAIIIRAIMVWISTNRIEALLVLLAAYAMSQVILTGATFIRIHVFKWLNKGRTIEDELKANNIALGLVFAGRKIGTAFAITVASNLVVYEIYDLKTILLPWFAVSIAVILILKALAFVAEKIILFGVNAHEEVLEQRNIAVGALRAVIYIAIAIMLAEF